MTNHCFPSSSRRAAWLLAPTILSVLCAASLPAQDTLQLSPRLGTVISPLERAYFGLFPNVDRYASALFVGSGDSVKAIIRRSAEPRQEDTVVVLSRTAYAVLGRYVNGFEGRFYRDSAESGGASIRGLARPVNLFTVDGPQLTIEVAGGGIVQGVPVYADVSSLVIGPVGFRADRDSFMKWVTVLRPRDIVRISDNPDWGARGFGDGDMTVGRNDTIYRDYLLDHLRSVSVYSPYPSPELSRLIRDAEGALHDTASPTVTVAAFHEAHRTYGLHLSCLAQIMGGNPVSVYGYITPEYVEEVDYVNVPGKCLPLFGLEYDLFPSFRLGVSVSFASASSDKALNLSDYESISAQTIALSFRWMIFTVPAIAFTDADRIEAGFGIGPAVQWLSREAVEWTDNRFTLGRTVFGGVLTSDVRFFLSNRFSLDTECRAMIFPMVRMGQIGTHYPYSLNLSHAELAIGVGVHL
ncbi:MAG: hypothetical protein JST22_12990 [Bacteroidetes bacterium]|nr:hypothetical protein [Bacteroidota bacterium]